MALRKYKILVLGADGFNANNEWAKVVSCTWGNLEQAPNPRDFDTVIVSCFVKDPEAINWDALPNLLNPEAVRNILFHDGRIIVAGDPRFSVNGSSLHSGNKFLEWTGLRFSWHDSGGDTVHVRQGKEFEKYSAYLQSLKKWDFSMESCDLTYKAGSEDTSIYETINVEGLASNRYNQHLAFEVTLSRMTNEYDYGCLIPKRIASGKLVFLPAISASIEDTLRIILRDLCAFSTAVQEPSWAKILVAPGQKEVDQQILEIRSEIAAKNATLASLEVLREGKRACLKLLYERELILEPIVWSMLRTLGARVEEPEEKNKEDGWITVQVGGDTYEGVLEIKSTKNDYLGEDGRKQLLDWINRGIEMRRKVYKGIFIGNSAVSKPLAERPSPFADNWKTSAELSKICALTTSDIFAAYEAHSVGSLNTEDFWKAIFACNGIFSFTNFMSGQA